MSDSKIIVVRNVNKSFNMLARSTTLKDMLSYHEHIKKKTHVVLNNISFEVNKGETLGIIGSNGSGKSTLLKLLSKILRPDSGSIVINGKTACLIELGAGFHPDMTGRENIFINASIFGISDKIIKERMDSIIDFSGIGDFIDERVRTYSSGMYLRLAFSVAINVDADVLLVDEILAVGDIEFRAKCLNKINDFKQQGGTIVIVSHDIGQVKTFCDKVIWLKDGEIQEYDTPNIVCSHYESYMDSKIQKNKDCN